MSRVAGYTGRVQGRSRFQVRRQSVLGSRSVGASRTGVPLQCRSIFHLSSPIPRSPAGKIVFSPKHDHALSDESLSSNAKPDSGICTWGELPMLSPGVSCMDAILQL